MGPLGSGDAVVIAPCTEREFDLNDSVKSEQEVAAPEAEGIDGATESPGSLSEIVSILIYSVLIALVVRITLFEPFNIPSESMLPTLMTGDYLFVSKYPYGYSRHSIQFSPKIFSGRIFESPVERGDVVVFKRPYDNRTDYIKRIVGLPGDRLQMIDSVLHINGAPVRRERIADFTFTEMPNTHCRDFPQYRFLKSDGTAECRYPRYRETLPNGVVYDTLDLFPNSRADNTQVFTVPEGHYFAMGDNRDNSRDSRMPKHEGVGFVPAENLVGRAEIIFFSTDGKAKWWQPWYWIQAARGERFFTSLRPDE